MPQHTHTIGIVLTISSLSTSALLLDSTCFLPPLYAAQVNSSYTIEMERERKEERKGERKREKGEE